MITVAITIFSAVAAVALIATAERCEECNSMDIHSVRRNSLKATKIYCLNCHNSKLVKDKEG